MPCPNSTLAGLRIDNFAWENFVDTIQLIIPALYKPNDLGDLVLILQMAESMDMEVKAIGSGWSVENIALSNNWVIDISELKNDITNIIDIDRDFIADCVVESRRSTHLNTAIDESYVHVEAGIKVIDLNRFLESKGLSMVTLGGAQGQSLAGAISTSTHGSDINETPLPDLVEAVHLVSENGQEYWIESDLTPLTDDDAALLELLPCNDTQIIRDDELLKSLQVSLGRFGVIYSYVLRVKNTFRTVEWAISLPWIRVKNAFFGGIAANNLFMNVNTILRAPSDSLSVSDENHIYFDLAFNPRNGNSCWVRRRWLTDDITNMNLSEKPTILCHNGLSFSILTLVGTALHLHAAKVLAIPFYGAIHAPLIVARGAYLQNLALNVPTAGVAIAESVDAILASQVSNELTWLINELNQLILDKSAGSTSNKPKRGVYWQVNSGTDESDFDRDCYNGSSIELIFNTDDRRFIDFLDSILALGPTFSQLGYISVRFSQSSEALLSMHNVTSEFAASVEVTSLHGMDDSRRWLDIVEGLGVSLGGIPHWGQMNNLTLSQTRSIYGDRLEIWKDKLESIVGSSMRFSNSFTRIRGLEPIDSLRVVRGVRREDGKITYLCNGDESWSPMLLEDAINHIIAGIVDYFVVGADGSNMALEVKSYLTTSADNDLTNNLKNLPEAPLSGLLLPPSTQQELQINAIQLESSSDRTWISYIGNTDENWAVMISLAEAHVQLGTKQYFILGENEEINLLEYRRYLTTPPNEFTSDNLQELPDC